MLKLIVRFLFGALGLYLAQMFIGGVAIDNTATLLIAALVLGVVNALVRPVVILLTLPLTILTLGLFLLIINAGMLGLTAYFLEGFTVSGLIPALLGSIVVSIVVWLGHMVVGQARR